MLLSRILNTGKNKATHTLRNQNQKKRTKWWFDCYWPFVSRSCACLKPHSSLQWRFVLDLFHCDGKLQCCVGRNVGLTPAFPITPFAGYNQLSYYYYYFQKKSSWVRRQQAAKKFLLFVLMKYPFLVTTILCCTGGYLRFPPFFMPTIPKSHPLMTSPAPNTKVNELALSNS